ncbi:Txe/YoeB family addiction module toxin [Longimicrobium sp.]|jgi:toxin YoeB|uniref:Txe/YoeB family addiction module toxin n=1 Tax=Longimicrobium sp. TaxID=2029185 RepID=UPI002ED97805
MDPRIATKVLALVEDVMRDPHAGLGKPEPLKHRRRAAWSRRITQEHRLIYEITDLAIYFLGASGHYSG